MFLLFMLMLLAVAGFFVAEYFVTKRNTERLEEAYRSYSLDSSENEPSSSSAV